MFGITTLISTIIGMIGGAVPDLLKELRDSRDAKREMELLSLRHRMELERLEKAASLKIQEVSIAAEAADTAAWSEAVKAAMASQPLVSGYAWIDGINAVLRPACTVMILSLFLVCGLGFSNTIPTEAFAPLFIGAVEAVLGFLFGYRSARKSAVNT